MAAVRRDTNTEREEEIQRRQGEEALFCSHWSVFVIVVQPRMLCHPLCVRFLGRRQADCGESRAAYHCRVMQRDEGGRAGNMLHRHEEVRIERQEEGKRGEMNMSHAFVCRAEQWVQGDWA